MMSTDEGDSSAAAQGATVFNAVHKHALGYNIVYDANAVDASTLNDVVKHLDGAAHTPHWMENPGFEHERIAMILKCVDTQPHEGRGDDVFVLVAWRVHQRGSDGAGMVTDNVVTLRNGGQALLGCGLLFHCSTVRKLGA